MLTYWLQGRNSPDDRRNKPVSGKITSRENPKHDENLRETEGMYTTCITIMTSMKDGPVTNARKLW
jgi:hypothetical protein